MIWIDHTHTHTHTHTHWAPGGPRETYRVCRLQLHPSPLSPPLQFTSFHPSIIPSLSFSLIPAHPPSPLPPLPLSSLPPLSFMLSLVPFPLTFKPTSAFEHRALYPSSPRLSPRLPLPISSIYLRFPSACPSACFTVLLIYLPPVKPSSHLPCLHFFLVELFHQFPPHFLL